MRNGDFLLSSPMRPLKVLVVNPFLHTFSLESRCTRWGLCCEYVHVLRKEAPKQSGGKAYCEKGLLESVVQQGSQDAEAV